MRRRRTLAILAMVVASWTASSVHANPTYKVYVGGTGDLWTDCSNGLGGNCFTVPSWAWGRQVDLSITDYTYRDIGGYYSIEQWECPDGVSCAWVYQSSGYFCKSTTADVPWQSTRIKVRVTTIDGYFTYCYGAYNAGIPTAGLITATFR